MRKISLILILFIILTASGCQTTTSTDVQASVQTGDVLVVLDDTLLQSQKKAALAELDAAMASIQTAKTAVDTAQAQYDLALSMAQAEEFASTTWEGRKPTVFDQPLWYFSKEENLQSAQNELENASTSLDDAITTFSEIAESAGSANFLEIEQKLNDTRIAYDVAKTVYDKTGNASDATELRDEGKTALEAAETDLKDAQQDYDDALTTDGAKDVLKARANVEVARQRYLIAQDTVRNLQTGEDSLSLLAQSKVVDQAKAALAQVQMSVTAAQANIDLIDDQIAMLTVKAPLDGVVLVSSVQSGEVIQAGMSLMNIGKLDSLKVTVYIPETDYGKIKLGQQVSLNVDSFPTQTFHANVTRISDQAEFTPQNVQTKEGRQTTVYAVELSVDNADGKLKPGMPVDVTFDNTASSQ